MNINHSEVFNQMLGKTKMLPTPLLFVLAMGRIMYYGCVANSTVAYSKKPTAYKNIKRVLIVAWLQHSRKPTGVHTLLSGL